MLEAARAGALRVLYVVGADPALDYPDARAWAEARARLGLLVVHDLFLTRTARDADVVLPVLTYAEHGGTVGNIEGRIQRQDAAVQGPGTARSDGQIFSALAERLGGSLAFASADDVASEIARLVPGWAEDARLTAAASAAAAAPCGRGRAAGAGAGRRSRARRRDAALRPGHDGAALSGDPRPGGRAVRRAASRGRAPARRGGRRRCATCAPRAGRCGSPARVLPTLHPGHAYVPRGYESAPVSALLDERGPVAVTVRPVGGAA